MNCLRMVAMGCVALALTGAGAVAFAQGPDRTIPIFHSTRDGERPVGLKPSQTNPPRPAFEYTDEGEPIMLKRYPYWAVRSINKLLKYDFIENKEGVLEYARKLDPRCDPGHLLSEQQRAIVREWGEPDYVRGPYKSTREDLVVDWCYHPMNRIFQFVDKQMVFEGPLTDQDRTAILHGTPRDVIVSTVGPNVRRETWVYRPYMLSGRERLFSFANGKLIYRQETP